MGVAVPIPPHSVAVAVCQFECTSDPARNVAKAEAMVREAAAKGAHIVLLQELFETLYFPQEQNPKWLGLAKERSQHPLLARMATLARELRVVLPVSFFEKCGQVRFNSVVVLDADGTELGVYRKSHIPDGPGYTEKFYFSPGNTGFKVFDTAYGRIGVGICWDQWFPECARAMVLQGAELLLYPTAIGSEPSDTTADTREHWTRVMQGHAAANLVPVVASNRIGTERKSDSSAITFYGGSFVAGATGEILAQAGTEETVLVAHVDLGAAQRQRAAWGVFRDRRPELYGALLTLDGGASR